MLVWNARASGVRICGSCPARCEPHGGRSSARHQQKTKTNKEPHVVVITTESVQEPLLVLQANGLDGPETDSDRTAKDIGLGGMQLICGVEQHHLCHGCVAGEWGVCALLDTATHQATGQGDEHIP